MWLHFHDFLVDNEQLLPQTQPYSQFDSIHTFLIGPPHAMAWVRFLADLSTDLFCQSSYLSHSAAIE